MVDLVFLVDESGSKSNSNKAENEIKEFGLMAGFILYEEGYNLLKKLSEDIISALNKKYKKVHLTDFEINDKNETIQNFFTFFSKFKCPWIYTAIYTQGFYDHHNLNKLDNNLKKSSMHSALFIENIMKLLAFSKENCPNDCMDIKIKVVTDTIADGIQKKFQEEVEHIKPFLLYGERKELKKIYNKNESKLEYMQYKGSIDNETFNKIKLDSLSIEIIIDDKTSFFSDILNHTLYKHIKCHLNSQHQDNFINLNSGTTIKEYKLFKYCYGYSDNRNVSFSDIAFFYRN